MTAIPSPAQDYAKSYLSKHQLYPLQLRHPTPDNHQLSVIIPCYDEPDVLKTLDSLWRCDRPDCGVEILVVVNCSEAAAGAIRTRNRQTVTQIREWSNSHYAPDFSFQVLCFDQLPERHAGVGLARKLGLDETVARFGANPVGDGVLLSLDADCLVDPNYLSEVHTYFRALPTCPAANIYFEHDLDAIADSDCIEGIAQYELHLRYYVHALRYVGFPYAHHAVGSSFAVRCSGYCARGGMNRRKAGEDFYFLQKFTSLSSFGTITTTRVRPSSRISSRVPFGTGQAMQSWQNEPQRTFHTYAPQIFAYLKPLVASLPRLWRTPSQFAVDTLGLHSSLTDYLREQNVSERIAEIQANTRTPEAFRKRFLHWFNPFRVMKYVRCASNSPGGLLPVAEAANTLLTWTDESIENKGDVISLLDAYRAHDRTAGNRPQRI